MRTALLVCLILAASCSGQVASTASTPGASPSAATSPHPAALATGGIVEYTVPDPATLPANCGTPCHAALGSMALGPDGNVWYVDGGRGVVGRINPSGKITQFTMPVELAGGAQTIAAGPGQSIWVLGRGTVQGEPDWILRVSTDGQATKFATGGVYPLTAGTESIAAGPDGNVWFTEFSANRVARLTPSGALTEFPTLAPNASPRGIVAGPDGNLWFAETNRQRIAIGRITPQGQQVDYPLAFEPSDAAPNDLAAGPDGNIWFTRWTGGLGHISPNGEVVAVALPQGSVPSSLVAGPDGNMWFTESSKNAIARISVTGVIREFSLPRRGMTPYGIAFGADGRIWFTEAGRIGSIGVKVPEAMLSRRVLIFADGSPKTVTVTNTGDAAMSIGTVRMTGVDGAVFAKNGDTCTGKGLPPGASCAVTVDHMSGGVSSVQSAFLELPDNATGSPQRVSLVAQLPNCRLPTSDSVPNMPQQGGWLDLSTGHGLYDARALFETSTNPPGVRTTAEPVLFGSSSAYFDRAAGRWLPVSDSSAVLLDGSRYAYTSYDPNNPGPAGIHLHVVDVASGQDRVLPLGPGFWGVVAFAREGIYLHQAYEGIAPGLTLVDPDTGTTRQVLSDGVVGRVAGSTAWVGVSNPADKLPGPPGIGGGSNEIDKKDISTGAQTSWFYAPGTNLYVVGVVGGWPVVNIWDGSSVRWVWVPSPQQPQPMDFPFTNDANPYFSGFVADTMGVWVGSSDGVYLWTTRTGGILVSDEPATPAGTCA